MGSLNTNVRVSTKPGQLQELAIDVVGPGAIIGLGALREEPFHCFDATTLSACEFKCLPAGGVRDELARNPDLCMEVLALAHEKLKQRALQLEEFALSSAAARLSRTIIRQFEAQGVPLRNGAKLAVGSQKLLARMTGCSRETVNKELTYLGEKNITKCSRGKLTVLDARSLRARSRMD